MQESNTSTGTVRFEHPTVRFEHPRLVLEPEDFDRRVVENKVSLSNCMSSGGNVLGTVIVANMHCNSRKIRVRYSTNDWATHKHTTADYIGSESEIADRFVFSIDLEKNETLHFVICYRVDDAEYWDNNNGKNYSLVLE